MRTNINNHPFPRSLTDSFTLRLRMSHYLQVCYTFLALSDLGALTNCSNGDSCF